MLAVPSATRPQSGSVTFSPGARLLLRLGDLGLPRSESRELLDGDDWTDGELRENLRDIERINSALGGSRLTVRALARATRSNPRIPMILLDVGTGTAGIPKALVRQARRQGQAIRVTATDSSPRVLSMADLLDYPEIQTDRVDALRLPYADRSFDGVVSSLLLHHLSPSRGVIALREMGRVARDLVIVNDLVRNRISHTLSQVLVRVGTKNRLTRHDGPLSVERANTLSEILKLIEEAGLEVRAVDQFGLYRVAVTGEPRR